MDIERALISKIIATGHLELAVSKGIRPEHFEDPECRDLYEYMLDFARNYKNAPTMVAVKADRPKFEWEHVQDDLTWVIDKFIVWVKRRVAQEKVLELAALTEDPEIGPEIDLHFLEVSRHLATLVPSTQVSRFSDMGKRIDEYEKRKAEGKPTGIPFGPAFPSLDDWTGGIQPHEMVTVMAFSGIGKSTLLQAIAFNTYIRGFTPLIISLEMEAATLLRRFDAMATALDYYALKRMELGDEAMATWREKAESVRERSADIPVIDSIRHCTPDHVFAETVRHKPDIVVIDYLSLMRSSRPSRNVSQWQSLTEITQDLKQNARTLKIPILAAAQSNRSGAKVGAEMDNIGYSLSIAQDSDILLGLFQDDDMREAKEMQIRLSKNRDGRLAQIDNAVWDFDTFTFREKRHSEKFARSNGGESAETPETPGFGQQVLDAMVPDKPVVPKQRKRPGGAV